MMNIKLLFDILFRSYL